MLMLHVVPGRATSVGDLDSMVDFAEPAAGAEALSGLPWGESEPTSFSVLLGFGLPGFSTSTAHPPTKANVKHNRHEAKRESNMFRVPRASLETIDS